MRWSLLVYLCIVMTVYFIVNLILNKFYKIGFIKVFIFTIVSTMLGAFSTMIMSFIESGNFTGTSFYGAVFLMPIFVLFLSKLFKVERFKLLNMSALLGLISCSIVKLRCHAFGCCGGKMIITDDVFGTYYIFPSQITESIFAAFVFLFLMILFFIKKDRKDLYPIAMIVYGIGRFILNSFRRTTPIIGFMAYGHIWSILSVIIGIIWLISLYNKECGE